MKNIQITSAGKIFIVIFIIIGIVTSCKKKDEKPECTTCSQGGGPAATANLNWKENGGAGIFADDYKFYSSTKTLSGAYGSNITLNVKLSSSAAGSYILTASGANKLTYLKNGFLYTATSGTVSITENAGSKLTGSFYSYGNSAGITSLVGDFTYVPIQ